MRAALLTNDHTMEQSYHRINARAQAPDSEAITVAAEAAACIQNCHERGSHKNLQLRDRFSGCSAARAATNGGTSAYRLSERSGNLAREAVRARRRNYHRPHFRSWLPSVLRALRPRRSQVRVARCRAASRKRLTVADHDLTSPHEEGVVLPLGARLIGDTASVGAADVTVCRLTPAFGSSRLVARTCASAAIATSDRDGLPSREADERPTASCRRERRLRIARAIMNTDELSRYAIILFLQASTGDGRDRGALVKERRYDCAPIPEMGWREEPALA